MKAAYTLIEEQKRRRSRIFLVLLWLCMLIISLSIILVVFNFLIGLAPQRVVSLDWCGYVALTDKINPQPSITGVSGSWMVPRITVTSDDRFSAVWTGIGGYDDATLIQVGTEQDCVSGGAVYSAWYELLPGDLVNIATLQINSGDRIDASIMLINSAANTWSVYIQDTATSQTFSKSLTYNSSRLSAEWIVERPTVNNGVSPLADFGSIMITNSRAVNNGTTEAINRFSFARITMYDRQNRQLASVSSLGSNGESFTVSYVSSDSVMPSFNSYFENTIAVTTSSNNEELLRPVQHLEYARFFRSL